MSAAIQECQPLASLECEKKQQAADCFDKLANIVIHRDKEIDTDERSLLKSRLNQLKKDQMAKRRAILASAVYDIDLKGNISEEPDCIKLIGT